MRRLSNSSAMTEARRFKTLMLSRAVGGGVGGVALPQATAQNQIIIADAANDWTLLAAPAAEGQIPIAGADPYTPAWGTTFPAYMTFDTGATLGGSVLSQAEDAACGFSSYRYSSDAVSPYWSSRKARGSIVSPTIVNDDDWLWNMVIHGHDGVGMIAAAVIRVRVDGIPGTDDMPAEIVLRTTPSGSDTPQTRVRIRSTGVTEFYNGLTFSGATGVNVVTIPDNAAQAVHIVDAGTIEYLRITSTDAQPAVVFNEAGANVDFRLKATGQTHALFVQGSDGKMGIWASTLNARVEIGGATGPAILNLPTNLATVDAGLSTRDIADESIVTFGTNVRSIYTGRIVTAKAGAAIRCDTRDEDTGYTVFHILTRAADDEGYDIPFKIAAGAPTNSLFIARNGNVGYGTILPANRGHVDNDATLFTALRTGAALRISAEATTTIIGSFGVISGDAFGIQAERSNADTAKLLVLNPFGGFVGVGLLEPTNAFHIHAADSGVVAMQFTNITTGVLATDGFATGIDASEEGFVWHYENENIYFGTNNVERMRILAGGTIRMASLAGSGVRAAVAAADGTLSTVTLNNTKARDWVIADPTVGEFGQLRIPWNCTVTRVDANILGGTSCTFNIEERGTLGSAGTNILSSDMVADTNGESVTSSFNNASLAAGNWLTIDVSAVNGLVDCVSITLTVTID